jgi:hypothetical protein
MADFVTTLTNAKKDKKQGNHRVEILGDIRLYYYFNTVIAAENGDRKFAVDPSYGTVSTKKSCSLYRSKFLREGYQELDTIQKILGKK